MAFFTARYRDKTCGPVAEKSMKDLVGETYLLHPENVRSFVVVINPAWTPKALEALTSLGFVVDETKEVCVGKEDDIKFLEQAGDVFNFALLAYIWFLMLIVGTTQARAFADYGRKVRDDERALQKE